MRKHSKEILNKTTCPFGISIKSINWHDINKILSKDDEEFSIIVKMNNEEIFLIILSEVMYNSVYKFSEDNSIEQGLIFYKTN